MPLHIDYRPMSFEEFRGNKTTKAKLIAMLAKPDKPHAMLFMGPSGCGKTTLARLVAAKLGCNDLETREQNAADQRGIDSVRDIIQQCRYQPLLGDKICYILDEAHGITGTAADALLKLLEDTPEHVFIMLCTTAPESLKETIRQRCTSFEVQSLKHPDMLELLNWIITEEKKIGKDVKVNKDIIAAIADAAGGAARKALVILDSIMKLDESEQMAGVYGVMLENPQTMDLCKALLAQGKGLTKWKEVRYFLEALAKEEGDVEKIRRSVLGYCQALLFESIKDRTGKPIFPLNTQAEADRVYHIMEFFEPTFFYTSKPGLALACYRACQI